ncbi:helix-turn-helix domain-containing protein [Limibacterium fermenti]|uniref:helix-turn-helix domain-containing protein n=1 Tax=Limibacterium fermenti TaxID=3229863 RepID=UPI000E84BB43|nr:AraC family transcriptional regulator [Porphyromonadaceae bacterium]HBX44347.1 AraC family transcriptional regulator [Porphyromonadaceae bacterium]
MQKVSISNYSFKKSLPQEFQILELKQLYRNSSRVITKIHRSEFYHIIWFQKGKTRHMVDFEEIEIEPDTVLFLNQHTIHRFAQEGDAEGKVILFTDNFFSRSQDDARFLQSNFLFQNLFSVSYISLCRQKSTFSDIIDLMINESKQENSFFHSEILRHYLHCILLIVEREMHTRQDIEQYKSKEVEYVHLFSDLLEKHFHTQRTVRFYAGEIGITVKRLNQATTKIIGKSPKDIIINRIILESKRQLVFSNRNIKEIAYGLGCNEPTNFIKFFKKHCRATPCEFRERFPSA